MSERRTPLSRDRVLRAALDLVDRDGVDALTMRRLGRELGVEAMSLYGYVDSKEDLIEGVVEQVFRQMPLITTGPGRWQDRLRRHAATYRSVLLAHPNAVRLVAGRPLITEGTVAFVESALGEIRSFGLDLATADRVLGVLAAFTLGQASEEVGHELRSRQPTPAPSAHGTVDGRRFPNVAAVGAMKPTDYDEQFELGISFIIAGIEQMLAAADNEAGSPDTASADAAGYDKVIG